MKPLDRLASPIIAHSGKQRLDPRPQAQPQGEPTQDRPAEQHRQNNQQGECKSHGWTLPAIENSMPSRPKNREPYRFKVMAQILVQQLDAEVRCRR